MAVEPDEVEMPTIYGTSKNNVLYEYEGLPNQIYGLGGNDTIIAAADDSLFNPGSGLYDYPEDYFDGGSGSDTVSYVQSDKKIEASLQTGIAVRIFEGEVQSTDYLDSIENLIGSKYDDRLYGSTFANQLRGGGGNDVIYGYGGNDQVWGDSGNDHLDGGDGNDTADGGTGNDDLYGGKGNDTLKGGDGADYMEGGSGNDNLQGGNHDDEIYGGSGNDRIEGGSGNDTIDGGSGTDTVVYTGSGAVTVSLLGKTAAGAWGNDTLNSIENVETGNGNDVVLANNGRNEVRSGGGNDVVYALDGDDIVYAGSGNDFVYGYDGEDKLYGDTGNDTLYGDGDDDDLYGQDGNDKLYGGDGNDLLFGQNGNDDLIGGDGDDTLSGGNSSDRLRGGDGLDTLIGGAGPDIIAWGKGDSGLDTISGFTLGYDKLSFEYGFFKTNAVGPIDLEDVLMVFDDGPDAWLGANTAHEGWTFIAHFENVDAFQLNQMIANESILAPSVGDGLFS